MLFSGFAILFVAIPFAVAMEPPAQTVTRPDRLYLDANGNLTINRSLTIINTTPSYIDVTYEQTVPELDVDVRQAYAALDYDCGLFSLLDLASVALLTKFYEQQPEIVRFVRLCQLKDIGADQVVESDSFVKDILLRVLLLKPYSAAQLRRMVFEYLTLESLLCKLPEREPRNTEETPEIIAILEHCGIVPEGSPYDVSLEIVTQLLDQ